MDSMQTDPANVHLVLVFKAPQRAKSRLRKQLRDATNELATHLLHCGLEDLRRWTGPVTVAATSSEDARWLADTGCWPDTPLVQGPGNLGERLLQVDLELRGKGAERVIIIGSDCPGMDNAYLTNAARQLSHQDYVLGKALDGGVSLMGARRPWPPLADLPWSTPDLGTALAQRCRLKAMLPTLRDVDDVDDLTPLARELASEHRPARVALRDWLKTWPN